MIDCSGAYHTNHGSQERLDFFAFRALGRPTGLFRQQTNMLDDQSLNGEGFPPPRMRLLKCEIRQGFLHLSSIAHPGLLHSEWLGPNSSLHATVHLGARRTKQRERLGESRQICISCNPAPASANNGKPTGGGVLLQTIGFLATTNEALSAYRSRQVACCSPGLVVEETNPEAYTVMALPQGVLTSVPPQFFWDPNHTHQYGVEPTR